MRRQLDDLAVSYRLEADGFHRRSIAVMLNYPMVSTVLLTVFSKLQSGLWAYRLFQNHHLH